MKYLRFFFIISIACLLVAPLASGRPLSTKKMQEELRQQEAREQFEIAVTLAKAGSYSASKKILQDLIRKDKRNGLYWFNLAQVYRALGKEKYAVFAFTKAARSKNKISAIAGFEVAESLYASNKPIEAAKAMLRIRKKHLSKQGRNKLKILKDATKTQLENYSKQAYAEEDYETAAKYSKWAVRISDSKIARKIASVSLAELGQLKAAKNLNTVSKQSLSLNDLKQELDRSLKSSGKKPKSFSAYSGFAYGHSNNIFAANDDDDPIARPTTQGYLGMNYTHKGEKTDIGFLYFLSWDQAVDVSTSESLSHSFENSYTFKTENSKFAVSPNMSVQLIKGTHFLSTSGLSMSYSYFTRSSEMGLSLSWTQLQGFGDGNDYLNGPSYRASTYYGFGWGSHYLSLNLSVDTSRAGDFTINSSTILPGAYLGYSPSVNYYYSLTDSINYSASLTFRNADYLNKTSGERTDQSLYSSMRLGYQVLDRLNIYISGNYNQNTSNFDTSISNQNYNQTTFSFGFNWDMY